MSICQIRFKYLQEDVIIQCKRNELMSDIINRFASKVGLSIDGFYFIYNEDKINLNLKLAQVNDKDKEIEVIVCQKEAEKKESETKIKSTQYSDNDKKSS